MKDIIPALKELITAASGSNPADLLIKNAQIVNVFSGDIEDSSVAIYNGSIAGIGDYNAKRIIDLKGLYLAPGLIDSHIHIESTMLSPSEFAKAVLPRGTTSVITDPHEIANVFGRKGIQYMFDASIGLPLDIYIMLPSCVPATSMETSGARLTAKDLKPFLKYKNVLGIAEVMNFPGVIAGERGLLEKINLGIENNKRIDGHAPGLSGRKLNGYIASKVSSDHESTTKKEAEEKLKRGLFVMIREGTTEKNLKTLLPIVTKTNSRRFAFVSDDRHPFDLLREGHLDDILRKAVRYGLDPVTAIQLVTINPAQHFGLREIGAIAPGYMADMVVFEDLRDFKTRMVFKKGSLVARDGRVMAKSFPVQKGLLDNSVNIDWGRAGGIKLRTKEGLIKVIQVFQEQIITKKVIDTPAAADGFVISDIERDILKVVVIERHRKTGNIGIGFVKGFGLKRGAIASSVAHDSHNIVAVGVMDDDILMAAKKVEEMNGGLTVVSDGSIKASIPLPIAGLMSDKPLKQVVESMGKLLNKVKELGCVLPDPFMTMSFLALPVIPEIRLTDKGIVDVGCFKIVSVFGRD
ncbi:MAG: adenine deaminase [Deltaproteobacteria bacterium]|nr:adenine deaminase [Deltaproteobacteria bacterium]